MQRYLEKNLIYEVAASRSAILGRRDEREHINASIDEEEALAKT
jgi:hypothetical protein